MPEREYMRDEWNVGLICPVHKKGDLQNYENYRGITLRSSIYKVFSNLLYERLQPIAEHVS